jgi:flagellar motor switch protein FliN/FliY
MHEEPISQAEIDALVRGISSTPSTKGPAPAPAAGGQGADSPVGLLQEVLREFAQRSAQALSDLVGMPCQGVLGEVLETSVQDVATLLSGPVLFGRSQINQGLPGTMFFGVPLPLALAIITQIYGGVAPSALDDSALGALVDGLTQMNQTGLSAFGDLVGRPVYGGAVEVLNLPTLAEASGWSGSTPVLAAAVDLSVGEENGRLYLLLPHALWSPLAETVRERNAGKAHAAPPAAPAFGAAPAPAPAAAPAPRPQQQAVVNPGFQAARFPDIAPRPAREESRNIELLMDVSLQVTVELGRTRKQIRDVLSMGPGSVLELDKLAGEQVDVLVNGKLIAKGEVVVIDENYGVRITDIISPVERVQSFR